MKKAIPVILFSTFASFAFALSEGWTESKRGGLTEWSSPQAAALLPVEWTVLFRAPTGYLVTVSAVASGSISALCRRSVPAVIVVAPV